MIPSSIGLMADSGGGKTTQIGELAKVMFRDERKKTLLIAADLGGHESIRPHQRVGIIDVHEIEQADDPFEWINDATSGKLLTEDHGLIAFDSGTSIGEALLNAITKDPAQIGQQKTQKFRVGAKKELVVGANNESHYGLVQGFLLDQIWRSTWLTRKWVTVLWTFGLDRAEKADQTPIVGPKLVGHALTSSIPKWFNYFWRLAVIPVPGQPARHQLYLQAQPEFAGTGLTFGNSRYPLDATSVLPAIIEPASIAEALAIIALGQQEAEDNLRRELGL